MLWSWESWSIMRLKSLKKEKKRATLLFILSWIQGRDEYEVKFSCQACFGLISTFL